MADISFAAYTRDVTESQYRIRALTDDDFDAVRTMFALAFLYEDKPEETDLARTLFEPDRALGAFAGDELAGTGAIFTRRMTFPGAGQVPFAAVTGVAVAAPHRRRGVLTSIMREQLHGLHTEAAEPVAALWASEGSIYGRFGYGQACRGVSMRLPKGTAFRPGVPRSDVMVRELPREQALPLIKNVYAKVSPQRVGWLDRSDAVWAYHLHERSRHGFGPFRFAVLPEAYAVYRTKPDWQDRGPRGALDVRDLVAADPASYATLLRYLLDMDLIGEITLPAALDEPLTYLLADPQSAVRQVFESLWVRLVDVERALAQRRYSAPVDVVLELADAFCPWNAGRWRLRVDADGAAEVTRTDAAADLALDVSDLGAAFLGGTTLNTLAAAGRVRELSNGALSAASLALRSETEPSCLEVF